MAETAADEASLAVERVRVPMRDGVHLSAVVTRPPEGSRPVLLVRNPYNEAMARTLPVAPALDAGFAVVVQSCRGTGASEGELRTFENETPDGLDTIAWLVDQPWCDGGVAMFGMSYLGMVQLAVSGQRPEGLVAIAPTVTPDDYRDGLVFRQGAFQLGQALNWHCLMTALLLERAGRRGEDVTAPAGAFFSLVRDMDAAYRRMPLADRPGITDLVPSWRAWLDNERQPAYWRGISYAPKRAATAVPGFHVGGWFDLFLRGTLDNYATLAASSPAGQHLVVGPWTHADQSGVAGERSYPAGGAQTIRLEDQQVRFLRESADGIPTTLAPVQIYVMGADRWRTEQEWPLARTDWQTWYLAADGVLGRDLPAAGAREYRHDPSDPVPTVGGANLLAAGGDGTCAQLPGPRDQRVLDGRRDVLHFSSAVLDDDLEVTGPLSVRLWAATSAADADFTAKLVDVYPDGRALWVADGIVRSSYRDGMDRPSPVEPGEVYEHRIDLGATSQVFEAGHRIRVDVASSNFPCYDRNSGSGKPAGEATEADFVVATQRILFGGDHPSSIELPVIPASTT